MPRSLAVHERQADARLKLRKHAPVRLAGRPSNPSAVRLRLLPRCALASSLAPAAATAVLAQSAIDTAAFACPAPAGGSSGEGTLSGATMPVLAPLCDSAHGCGAGAAVLPPVGRGRESACRCAGVSAGGLRGGGFTTAAVKREVLAAARADASHTAAVVVVTVTALALVAVAQAAAERRRSHSALNCCTRARSSAFSYSSALQRSYK